MGQLATGRSVFADQVPMECVNVGTVKLPAFGMAEIASVTNQDNRLILGIQQPTEFGWRPRSVVVGPTAIDPGFPGACYDSKWVRILCDTADGPPTAGDLWGPVANSSKARKYVPGAKVMRDMNAFDSSNFKPTENTVAVMRYEPLDVWARTETGLSAGQFAQCRLCWYNKDYAGTPPFSKLVTVDTPTPILFVVQEATGLIANALGINTLVFVRWDEGPGKWVLRGWVC